VIASELHILKRVVGSMSHIILQMTSVDCTSDDIEGGEAASLNDSRNGLHT